MSTASADPVVRRSRHNFMRNREKYVPGPHESWNEGMLCPCSRQTDRELLPKPNRVNWQCSRQLAQGFVRFG
jgi:hypothetical protein